MKKTIVPARYLYRIDHATMGEGFYAQVFDSREDTQAHIDELNPGYREKLTIVKFHEPEHYSYDLGSIRL